jgi:hypothetical protein
LQYLEKNIMKTANLIIIQELNTNKIAKYKEYFIVCDDESYKLITDNHRVLTDITK